MKDIKDFGVIGDGIVDDTLAIQKALDSVYGDLYLGDGTYLVKGILKIPSWKTLTMSDNATILRGSDNNILITNKTDGTYGGYTANYNITIKGGNIDGNRYNFPTRCTLVGFGHVTNVKIEGVKFEKLHDWHMVELNAVKHGSIKGCHFEDYGGDTWGTEMVQLDLAKSTVEFPWFGVYDNTTCYDIKIEDNKFINGVRGVGSHTAIAGARHQLISIRNNYFEDMRLEAVKPLAYQHVRIEDNDFVRCGHGIWVDPYSTSYPCRNYKIEGNTFVSTNVRPIKISAGIEDGIINDNFIDGSATSHGIGVDVTRNFKITNNKVYNCWGTGIWNYGSLDCTIEGNTTLSNNKGGATNRYDLTVGLAGSVGKAVVCLVKNNIIGTWCADNADVIIFEGNILRTGETVNSASVTRLEKRNNFIYGEFVDIGYY